MNDKEIVLITGSSGFIGSSLARYLTPSYLVIGIDRDEPKDKIPGVLYHAIDLTSSDDIENTLKKIKQGHGDVLHSVVHFVAYYSFSGEDDSRYQSITVEGTRSLMINLKKLFHIEQFIFSSSMLVYAPVKLGEKITDNSPLEPSWPYPKSKVTAENILHHEHGQVPVVNLRIAGVYDDFAHSPTISNQIVRIHERWLTSVLFPGNSAHGQAFLHLEDLVEAISLLIKKRHQLGQFENFVLGEETVMSYGQLQKKMGDLLHQRAWPLIRVPPLLARVGSHIMGRLPFMREPFIKPWMIEHSDEHFDIDMSRLKRILNWHPKKSLEETLPVIITNLKQEPKKWYAINKIAAPLYRTVEMIGREHERGYFLAAMFNIFIGLWLIANPFTFGELERGEFWSQIFTGLVVCVFATLSLVPTIRWCRWVNAFIGMWLLFSPLIFESASAAAYSNDTLIAGLIMLASVYTPSPPQSINDPGIPPGWSYNPSTAGQRIPIMFLAFLGFLFSRYLAAYQLGHISSIWEPFFGEGTAQVLTSEVSRAFPISDAGLGALTYLLDIIAASIGGRERWRALPWAVILFGIMIIPAGVTSIVLIMLQPISVGAWCTVCIITAFIMLLMVPPAIDEVLASAQFLKRAKNQGQPFWRTFWLGGPEPERQEVIMPEIKPQGSLAHLILASALGIWLMFSPWALEIKGLAANNIYIVAALITTFAVIACAEVGRIVRLINVPLGIWLSASAWFLGPIPEIAQWHSLVIGLTIAALSLPLGRVSNHFGSTDRLAHWTPFKIRNRRTI